MRLIDADKLKEQDFGENYYTIKVEIDKAPTVNAIQIPDNATSGDVIKAIFPDADYVAGANFMHIVNVNNIGEISIPLKWWNAPYKAGDVE